MSASVLQTQLGTDPAPSPIWVVQFQRPLHGGRTITWCDASSTRNGPLSRSARAFLSCLSRRVVGFPGPIRVATTPSSFPNSGAAGKSRPIQSVLMLVRSTGLTMSLLTSWATWLTAWVMLDHPNNPVGSDRLMGSFPA